MGVIEGDHRLPSRLGVGVVGLVGLSGTAVAHGPHEHGGEPVGFALVVGLPTVAGLVGGVMAVRRLRGEHRSPTGRRAGIVLGVTLVVLGLTFATSAVTTSPGLGIAGGVAGTLFALSTTGGDRAGHRAGHADLTLGAVSAHRLLEGVAIGALYSAGATVGLFGAALLAGHAAFETAAVGGTYAKGALRTRAVGAIFLVQTGYAGGAVAGFGVADVLPTSTRALALAIAGGALVIVGAGEVERSTSRRWPVPVGGRLNRR